MQYRIVKVFKNDGRFSHFQVQQKKWWLWWQDVNAHLTLQSAKITLEYLQSGKQNETVN